jgi:hypothetical protein
MRTINNFGADVPFSLIIWKTIRFMGSRSGHEGGPSVFSPALFLSFCCAQYEGTNENTCSCKECVTVERF